MGYDWVYRGLQGNTNASCDCRIVFLSSRGRPAVCVSLMASVETIIIHYNIGLYRVILGIMENKMETKACEGS